MQTLNARRLVLSAALAVTSAACGQLRVTAGDAAGLTAAECPLGWLAKVSNPTTGAVDAFADVEDKFSDGAVMLGTVGAGSTREFRLPSTALNSLRFKWHDPATESSRHQLAQVRYRILCQNRAGPSEPEPYA